VYDLLKLKDFSLLLLFEQCKRKSRGIMFFSIFFLLDEKERKNQGKFKAQQWSYCRTGLRNHVTTITAPSHIAAKFSNAMAHK
jgi:hypothetical protein